MTDCTLLHGDALERLATLRADSVQTCVTSPPYYGLRDYGQPGQIGLERSPEAYVARLVAVFEGVRRVLVPDGTLWLNLGDSYGPGKQLLGMPWRVAFALQGTGWCLRQDIIWAKPNPMPAPVTDRCVSSHEYLFLLSKSPRYFFDHKAIQETATGGASGNGFRRPHRVSLDGRGQESRFLGTAKRNRRSVWAVTPTPFKGAHFATMPTTLVEPCILAGSRPGDVVLDPFNGSGTTGLVALSLCRRYVGIELSAEYLAVTRERLGKPAQLRVAI